MKYFEKFNANKISADIDGYINLHLSQKNISEQFYIDVLAHYGLKDFDTNIPTSFTLKTKKAQYTLSWDGKYFSMKQTQTL